MPAGTEGGVKTCRTRAELRSALKGLRGRTAFVPTMGALHEGHRSLVRLAHAHADHAVASVFVNPAQFAPHEDFSAYPRTLEADLRALEESGAAIAYLPDAAEMYPEGFDTGVLPGKAARDMEGAVRPHFFGGVLAVVLKLLMHVRPGVALFGEKDYQQLVLVRRMARDFDLGVEIVGGPTVRDPETGLALSSRNRYLSPEGLKRAAAFPRLLRDAMEEIARRKESASLAELSGIADSCRARLSNAAGIDAVDYVELRHADTLALPLRPAKEPLRLLAAVRIEGVRLLDNQ
jgi:pantoate--beta-alanine ligase